MDIAIMNNTSVSSRLDPPVAVDALSRAIALEQCPRSSWRTLRTAQEQWHTGRSHDGVPRTNTCTSCRRRRAFSLIEMMVAIVILGMGLLMAATMFPAGWTRARKLAEFTTQITAGQTAATTVRLLTRVAAPASDTVPTTSFLGDFDESLAALVIPPDVEPIADTAVHVLHIENALADPDAILAAQQVTWAEWDLHNRDMMATLDRSNSIEIDPMLVRWWDLITPTSPPDFEPPAPQVSFVERVLPPLPRRPDVVPPNTSDELTRWESMLASRRFAWAVLYKLDELPATPSETRSITMFFVTLRRTQASHRFARQDPQGHPPALPDVTTKPKALDRSEDMVFPVPWLVNIKVLGHWDSGGAAFPPPDDAPTGIPSEAVANPDPPDSDARLIGQMLDVGSVLIDRLTGSVYTVKQHRFTGDGNAFDEQAAVTLDREILIEDVDDTQGGNSNGQVDPGEDLRDFWVFPPPVLADASTRAQGLVTFDGVQPVVSVETRQMYFSP